MKLWRTGFHLSLEMPEANLVSGMRMLLGTFGKAWNIRRQRQGHVFQGRYKAVPVAGEGAADAYYSAETLSGKNSHAGDAVRTHRQGEAERILSILAGELGLPESRKELERLKKGDPGKVVCAALVKRRTAVSNDWIAERLAMGHPASMTST